MSILIPLLLPSVVNATANVALGITNAVQGTSTNISFKIGNKVFTTNRPFPFDKLPPELRMEIIEMALEMSKELILPPMDFVPAFQPLGPSLHDAADLHRNNPLNPDNPHYRSIVGETRSANGYPLSSWKWMTLNTEWRDYIRRKLWTKCSLTGTYSYRQFDKILKRPDFDIFSFVNELELHQGFGEPTSLYALIRHPQLTHLESLSIVPLYPYSPSPFEDVLPPFDFGLQLIPVPSETRPRLKHLALGLPLELTTNAAQRQHLGQLKPEKFSMTVLRPSSALFSELASALAGVTDTLSIRYLNVSAHRELSDPASFVCSTLDAFKHVHLHLPARANSAFQHPYIGRIDERVTFADRIIDLILADKERQERYTVWIEDYRGGFNLDLSRREEILYQPAEKDKILFDIGFDLDEEEAAPANRSSTEQNRSAVTVANGPDTSVKKAVSKGKDSEKSWERETNLKLLGGLISLRLESKKR